MSNLEQSAALPGGEGRAPTRHAGCSHPIYANQVPFFGKDVSIEYINALRDLLGLVGAESLYDEIAHLVAASAGTAGSASA